MYPGFANKQVSKVNEDVREIWVVKLDAPSRLLTVRIENNQPEEAKKISKAALNYAPQSITVSFLRRFLVCSQGSNQISLNQGLPAFKRKGYIPLYLM